MYSLGDKYRYEELLQEVRVALWKEINTYGLSRFQRQSSEKTWIYRLAINTILVYLREYINKHSPETINEAIIEGSPSSYKQDVEELMEEVMVLLSPDDQRLLMLSLEGYRYNEIANMENMTTTNVGTRLNRIRGRLTKKLHSTEQQHID